MDSKPSISLVTPTLNAGRFLPEALESVQAQGIAGIEHIVADGGSTDDSVALARAAAHRPTVLDGTDTGIYDGMNRGLAAAHGDIVGILNADDLLAPEALAKIAKAFADDPALEAVTGGCRVIDAQGRPVSQIAWPDYRQSAASLLFGVPVINARFFRRSLLERIGLFDPGMGLAADRALLWRIMKAKARAGVIEAPLYIYRAHSGSSSLAGDRETRLRIWQEHLKLADRLRPEADGRDRAVLRLWRALEGAKALRQCGRTGDRDRADVVKRSLKDSDPFWRLRLPQALALALRWRGRHSGI
ncbi:MAG: glycosyltransferase family 2 protein [Methyloligella sp. ZOD6]